MKKKHKLTKEISLHEDKSATRQVCSLSSLKTDINLFTKAELTDEAKALLAQAKLDQSFVTFSVFNEQTLQLDIRVYPTCQHGAGEDKRVNKEGKPFSYQGKEYPVIEEEPRGTNARGQQVVIRSGRIHVQAAAQLGISPGSAATGAILDGEVRFNSTSHNKVTFTYDPLFCYLYAYDIGGHEEIQRKVPTQLSELIGKALIRGWRGADRLTLDLQEAEMEFASMPTKKLISKLTRKLLADVEQGKFFDINNIIMHCHAIKLPINLEAIILHAIDWKNAKVVWSLISEFKEMINLHDEQGNTLLDRAIANRAAEIVDDLLTLKADASYLKSPEKALLFAVESKPFKQSLAESVLKAGKIDLFSKNATGDTLLGLMVKNSSSHAAIKFIIDNLSRDRLNSPDENKKIILDYAVENGNVEVVKTLLENKLIDEAVLQNSLFRVAASKSPVAEEIIKLLIDHGKVCINNQLPKGQTLLHIATYFKNNEMVKQLLKQGANPGLKDAQNLTPLDYAKKADNKPAMKLIKEKIAKPAQQALPEDKEGDRPKAQKIVLSTHNQVTFVKPPVEVEASESSNKIAISQQEWNDIMEQEGLDDAMMKDMGYVLKTASSLSYS